jgi:hypothetical protein
MDPDGMDSELEGEGDLQAPENITQSAHQREQQVKQASAPMSDTAHPIRSRRVDESAEGENEDEEDEDMEPRSTPRSASSQPPYGGREADRNRPSPSGDRRR